MLRECPAHGYFRGESCSLCSEEGKFLMNDRELDRIGRIMAGVLRHFPERYGLAMDEQGWISIKKMIHSIQNRQKHFKWLRPHHIDAIVNTDEKGRYQIKNDLIRATYGHSLDLDLDLPTDQIPDQLYYPTTNEEEEILLENGLKPSDRKKVHLSKTPLSAYNAGINRCDVPVIIEIEAAKAIEEGIVIKRAGKTVFVTDEVPSQYMAKIEYMPSPEEMPKKREPRVPREQRNQAQNSAESNESAQESSPEEQQRELQRQNLEQPEENPEDDSADSSEESKQ